MDTKTKPIAVLISDVHYNLQTLELADKAMNMAIDKANELAVSLIVAGDLHDTKANIRGECIEAIIHTLSRTAKNALILCGNHDLINEKSTKNSLTFVESYASLVLWKHNVKNVLLVSYKSDIDQFREAIDATFDILIMHQGVIGAGAGHYIKDSTAVPAEWLEGRRVISGHYHERQTMDLGDGGKLDYIGNPYTLGFGEASHPPKGFQILHEDGSLEFVPTNLRKHCVTDLSWNGTSLSTTKSHGAYVPGDLLWVKVTAPKDVLRTFSKKSIGELLNISEDFRLDLIPDKIECPVIKPKESKLALDYFIDNSNIPGDQKPRLKSLWKAL